MTRGIKTYLNVFRLVGKDDIIPEDTKIVCCTQLFDPLPVAIAYEFISELRLDSIEMEDLLPRYPC